jgi:hypothetical protein
LIWVFVLTLTCKPPTSHFSFCGLSGTQIKGKKYNGKREISKKKQRSERDKKNNREEKKHFLFI